MADFTFDGGGSTFVFYKKYGSNFNVNNCLRVRLTNFNIDWDWDKDPIASIVKIENIGKDADGNFIDIKFVDYDKFPKQNVRFVIMTPYDPVAKAVGVEGGKEYNFGNNDGKNNPKTNGFPAIKSGFGFGKPSHSLKSADIAGLSTTHTIWDA